MPDNTQYAVSVGVIVTDDTGAATTIYSPTFYLHADVQGITDEAHAERIVNEWFGRMGLKSEVPECPGSSCPCANERATPIRRLLVRRVRPLPPARTTCDLADRDYRFRFWKWLGYRALAAIPMDELLGEFEDLPAAEPWERP